MPTYNPLGLVTAIPLPWRKITPWHKKVGARAMRFTYGATTPVPSLANPQPVLFRYDAGSPMDRIIGFTLSVAPGNSAGNFLVQELNTGWFLSYALPGTTPIFINAIIETLPDEVSLQFYFSASPNANVYVSFQNVEVVPVKI